LILYYWIEALEHHIREHVRLAQQFAAWVRDDSRFELAAPAQLNLVCFRLRAADRTEEDHANQLLMERLNASGDLYLTHTKLDGKFTLRFCVGQTNTQARHVERAWQRIQQETELLGNS
jgi:aromatic-L-amino-acid decarboxylase